MFFHGAGVAQSQATWGKGTNPIDFAPHIKKTDNDAAGQVRRGNPAEDERGTTVCTLTEPKSLVLYDGGHAAAPELFVKELNAWLDQTLGAVKR